VEEAEVVLLWGSNAREAHPIFFHHVLKAKRAGARVYVVDPRRTATAAWADVHLPLEVGTDIALAHTMAREILDAGLWHRAFVENATEGFEAFRAHVAPWTLARGEAVTGVPAADIRTVAHAWARAERAQICWTLGITEHHNAVDNVRSLINLGLLGGHVGRPGSGINPLRGQNNVQGGGDMGALPHKLAGFQDVEDPAVRARFDAVWGSHIPDHRGFTLTQMFDAMEHGTLTAALVIGENPAASEADVARTRRLLAGLDALIVQDLFLTRTAELAHVVFPASAAWCETEGTVTNSERRVQRVRAALRPPGEARDDIWILAQLARRLGRDLGDPTPQALWDELRTLSPMHRGMSWARLEREGGIAWPCPSEDAPGAQRLHERLWEVPCRGPRAPFACTAHAGPVEALTPEFPVRLTTGRRLDAFNTGVQSGGLRAPIWRQEAVDLSPDDAARLGVTTGSPVRVVSRRGSVVAEVRIDPGLQPGLVFMTYHDADVVDTNVLTIDATDPLAGTAEFKAAAVRIEPLRSPGGPQADRHAADC
jgi:predicted molibdopterin-dependent oxidoreductase YjgC